MANQGEPAMNMNIEMPEETVFEREVKFGEILRVPLEERMKAKATINPSRNFDVGNGPGKSLETVIEGGVIGVMIDARGRPLTLPDEEEERRRTLLRWYDSLDLYAEVFLKECMR